MHPSSRAVNLNNCKLSELSQTRDLGITVCNSLSPTVHVMDIVSKAHRHIGHLTLLETLKLLSRYSVGSQNACWDMETTRILNDYAILNCIA